MLRNDAIAAMVIEKLGWSIKVAKFKHMLANDEFFDAASQALTQLIDEGVKLPQIDKLKVDDSSSPLEKLENEVANIAATLLDLQSSIPHNPMPPSQVTIPKVTCNKLIGLLKEFNQSQKFGAQKANALLILYPIYIDILKTVLSISHLPAFRQLSQCGFIARLLSAASGNCHNMTTGPLIYDLESMKKS